MATGYNFYQVHNHRLKSGETSSHCIKIFKKIVSTWLTLFNFSHFPQPQGQILTL
jgi:hypothetical protein